MKDADYVYAVGRIRVKELSLLSSSDIKRLVSSKSYKDAAALLNAKGYEIENEDYSVSIKKQREELWKLIKELVKDISQFDSLIIKNDYHNLKAALKASVFDLDAKNLLIAPGVYDPLKIYDACKSHDFEALPKEMADSARKAYDVLARTRSAQRADIILDKKSMEEMLNRSKNNKDSSIFNEIAERVVFSSDIKIVYRSIISDKSKEFMEDSVCPCSLVDVRDLVSNAGSLEEFYSFLESSGFIAIVEKLKLGASYFEKYCDDLIIEIIERGKRTSFGIDPIVSYYLAKEAELLSVRIILSGKLNGTKEDDILKRAREVYV